jgi:short-subunit dehydrogenase
MKSYMLITGATGGLGSALALDCARRGYDLVLSDRTQAGAAFAETIRETYGVEAHYLACDLTDPQSRQEFYAQLARRGWRFWSLINVAGLDYEGAFLERTREQILTVARLNVESTLDTTYSILKSRDPHRRFMLINVASLAAFFPMPYKALYAASKRFILNFSLALAEEIKAFGSVTALCPAGMPTTLETSQAIFAQGFWGKVTAYDASSVARLTVDQALKGKTIVIPGRINQFIQSLGSLAPERMVVKNVGSRWQSAQKTRSTLHPRKTTMPANS